MIDIEEIFLRLESQNFKRMTVKSHLKQPVYFLPTFIDGKLIIDHEY